MHPPFNESYRGSPPWDIGKPQAEFVRLACNGEIRERVLDVGCGTGENAINYIKESRIETRFHERGGKGLLSSITIG